MTAILELNDAVSEAVLLQGRDAANTFPTGDEAYFSIFRKYPGVDGRKATTSQKSYRMPMLEDVVAAARGCSDIYISQSSFHQPRRQTAKLKQVRACWVDLDLYNLGLTPNAATVADIIAHGESLGLPTPSSVIHSGRGAYLKWYLERPVQADHLPAWKVLQAALTGAYRRLAADPKARDASRVFRILQSVNSKSGERVHRLDGSATLYNFVSLCESVEAMRQAEMPVESLADGATLTKPGKGVLAKARTSLFRQVIENAERGDPDALLFYSELRQPIMLQMRSARSLSWKRFLDMRDLAAARGGIAVGERDIHMFWMLNELAHAGVVRTANWETEVRQLLRAFPRPDGYNPLEDGSMSSLKLRLDLHEKGVKFKWQSSDVNPLYTPSNAHLIETFAITPAEMDGMRTLITPEVKGRRRRERLDGQNQGRAGRRLERESLRQQVHEAFDKAVTAAEEGGKPLVRFNVTQLAQELGAERSAVSRLWRACLEAAGMVEVALVRTKNVRTQHAKQQVHSRPADQMAAPVPPSADLSRASLVRREAEHKKQSQQRQQLSGVLQAMAAGWGGDSGKSVDHIDHWATGRVSHLLAGAINEQGVEMTVGVNAPLRNVPLSPAEKLERKMALLHAAQGRGSMPSPNGPLSAGAPTTGAGKARLRELASRVGAAAAGAAPAGGHQPPSAPPPTLEPASSTLKAPTAQDRLRALNGAAKTVPPFQRARVQAEAGGPLVPGGPPAPARFPDEAAWPHMEIPPGSNYTAEEWAAARADAHGIACAAIELQNSVKSVLLQIPLASTNEGRAKSVIYRDGKAVVQDAVAAGAAPGNPFSSTLAMCFSDCLLVTETSWPAFPGAAEAKFVNNGITLRVIRPRADYTDPGRMWRVGARLTGRSAESHEEVSEDRQNGGSPSPQSGG